MQIIIKYIINKKRGLNIKKYAKQWELDLSLIPTKKIKYKINKNSRFTLRLQCPNRKYAKKLEGRSPVLPLLFLFLPSSLCSPTTLYLGRPNCFASYSIPR
jgi:hypothetical protein